MDTETNTVTFSAHREGKAKFVSVRIIMDDREPTPPISAVHDDAEPSTSATVVDSTIAAPISTNPESTNPEEAEKWKYHRRCGHLSGKYLKILSKNRTAGIPTSIKFTDVDFRRCEICLMAKSTELGHNTVRRQAQRRLEIVSSDILGPFTEGKDGEKFVATFVDNFTNFVSVTCLKKKGDVADAFAWYHKRVEAKFPEDKLHLLRSDRAREYIDGTFRLYCNLSLIHI